MDGGREDGGRMEGGWREDGGRMEGGWREEGCLAALQTNRPAEETIRPV